MKKLNKKEILIAISAIILPGGGIVAGYYILQRLINRRNVK